MKNGFKAYDRRNKRFIAEDLVAVNGDGEVFLYHGGIEEDGYVEEVFNIEIMEYSGKQDRQGAKLYRGDIVKAELEETDDDTSPRFVTLPPKTIIGVVVIRPSEGAKLLVKKITPKGISGISIGRTLRIDQSRDIRIGDIYTTPELLLEESEVKEKC